MWITQLLSQVADVVPGNSVPAKQKDELYAGVEGMPYVATKDIGFDGIIDYQNGICIPKNYLNKFKISPIGATLVCVEGGSAGRKIAYSLNECCYVNKLVSFQPNSKIIPKFLYYYVLSDEFQLQFRDALHGLIGGVSLSKMKNFNISYPPLAEQQRIVAKLDAAFAEIDGAIKSSVDTVDSSKLVLTRLRDEIFSPDEDEKPTWSSYKLNDILKSPPKNGKSPPKELQSDEGTPLLKLSAVTGNVFDAKKSTFTKASVDKTAQYWIENGDLLITRANTRKLVGHVAIVKDIREPVMYPDLIMKMRVNEDIVSTKFIHQYLMTSNIRQYIMLNAKGANPTMVKINQLVVKDIPVKIPPISIQKKLLKLIEGIQTEITILQTTKLQKQQALIRLKQVILAQELQSEAA